MPKIYDPTLDNHTLTSSHYGFSGENHTKLGSTEYTLATVVVDTSSSVNGFASDIETFLKTVLKACRDAPRADNLMLRVMEFNDTIREIHGYTLLSKLKEDDYNGAIRPTGTTSLYDATFNAVEATVAYAKYLDDYQYDKINAVVFVITDGQENRSSIKSAQLIADQVRNIDQAEVLESIRLILIGLNVNAQLDSFLTAFKDQAGFDQYIAVQQADAKSIARISNFVSNTISSVSLQLGKGGPSIPLTF